MKNSKSSKLKGFTLIELLVVVLIIGILAAVALPQYQKAVLRSRLSTVHTILNSAKKQIMFYRLEQGAEPTNTEFKNCCMNFPGVSWQANNQGRIGDYMFRYEASALTGTFRHSILAVVYAPSTSFIYSGADLIGWELYIGKNSPVIKEHCMGRGKGTSVCQTITGLSQRSGSGTVNRSGFKWGNYNMYNVGN